MKTKNLHLFRAFFTLSLLLHILSSPSFAQEAPPKTLGGCICQGENVEICLGEEVVIGCEAPIQPCESYCYKWTPAEDAISNGTSEDLVAEAQLLVSPEETTTYILTISDEAGEIVAEESYTVTVLGVRASIFPSSPLICPTIGNIVELTAFPNEGDFSYEWASTPAGPTAFPTTATIQVDVPAVYTVSVTDNETGCISVEEYKLIDHQANMVLSTEEFKVVGTRPIRHDGPDKVMGRARYAADIHLPGMLHGKILRSPYAHARIQLKIAGMPTPAQSST